MSKREPRLIDGNADEIEDLPGLPISRNAVVRKRRPPRRRPESDGYATTAITTDGEPPKRRRRTAKPAS